MEIVSGTIPCTDASRRRMRHQLRALHIWQGLPTLFATLNPADTKHPFTILFSSAPDAPWSPKDSDAALYEAMQQVQLLHRVAVDPVAVARAFHEHVQFFFEHLLGCCPLDGPSCDGISSADGRGVLGPVAAYFGVTEPQLRGSLHIHILIHLYSFSTPAAFCNQIEQNLRSFATRLLDWASSLLCTSLESVAVSLPSSTPAAELLRHLQPLPYAKLHQDLLQQELDHSWDFDLARASWWLASPSHRIAPVPPWSDPFGDISHERAPFLPWPRSYLITVQEDDDVAPVLLYDLRHSILHCCLHECRARTCHKGAIGRRGFCRMGFWWWKNVAGEMGDAALWQRCHGLPLLAAPEIGTVPPHANIMMMERHHPFHTRFNPAILACTKCNHDVNILLRAPLDSAVSSAHELASLLSSSTLLATYYITAYISKVQPHIANLWRILEAGQRRLEAELQEQERDTGAKPSPMAIMRRALTRMLTGCQRRAHKSLPEMCHYLLGYPEAYCSHTFRPLYLRNLLRRAQAILPLAQADVQEPETVARVAKDVQMMPDDSGVDGACPNMPTLSILSQETDYLHRGAAFCNWPFYFYVAAVQRTKSTSCKNGSLLAPFASSHPDVQHVWQRVALHEQWSIPQFVGCKVPTRAEDPEQRALVLLLLFKPWHEPDLHDLLALTAPNGAHAEAASWTASFADFLAATRSRAQNQHERPVSFTAEYWAHRGLSATNTCFCALSLCLLCLSVTQTSQEHWMFLPI